METITLENDIKVFCVTADSFPEGIMEAYKKLNEKIPLSSVKRIFGLSRPENGNIVYKAAAEVNDTSEAEKIISDTLVIKKGNYISFTIYDYMKDLHAIGKAFKELLSNTGIDPEGYCVEWYVSEKDVKCMIRLA